MLDANGRQDTRTLPLKRCVEHGTTMLRVNCYGLGLSHRCDNTATFHITEILPKLKRGEDTPFGALNLVCSKCGSKRVGAMFHRPGGPGYRP